MDLINIKGNTFYIKGGTNTGVYIYNDNTALIIDPGLSGLRPKRIINILENDNINLKFIINTHEHNDHYGACNQFREFYKDVNILCSQYAKLYIEHPSLFSKYIIGGKSNEFMDERLRSKCLEQTYIDEVLNEGIVNLNNEDFKVIDFKGHTPGSIGILTKDKVLFVGDLLIGLNMFEKYDFLFLYDLKEYINSLDKLRNIDFEYIVASHSKDLITKKESEKIIKNHEAAVYKYVNQIKEELNTPMGVEVLLKNIILKNSLKCNYKEYHFFKSSLISVISYLASLQEIDYILSQGELLYYTKRK
ncbi:MBL fold metallo-hydrolase [Romboutsia sedimentorum]|uniref:MBL fold metallo-hydrolase n=1 Tax=Romboutsia sedimentorum TaxID=1368474 RepID=A0ABT7ED53_9FIRM|nr:MBL fold metallo-hydrolase [Romboutsia sedimentorum]MDK2564637.1 MBL fold metallo-hydrolase [Romboutsia sedimentorum]